MGSAHAWQDLPAQLKTALPKVNDALKSDGQYQAFTTTEAIVKPATFGIKSAGNENVILVTVDKGKGNVTTGNQSNAAFTLSALPEQWEEFFKPVPVAPYQSYWVRVSKV